MNKITFNKKKLLLNMQMNSSFQEKKENAAMKVLRREIARDLQRKNQKKGL